MTSRRVIRVRDLVKKEASRLLLTKVKDPRLSSVSITRVEMTPDLKRADIYYSFYDSEQDHEEIGRALARASGFFRREIGRTVDLKFVPEIYFQFDQSMEYAQHIDELLSHLEEGASSPKNGNQA